MRANGEVSEVDNAAGDVPRLEEGVGISSRPGRPVQEPWIPSGLSVHLLQSAKRVLVVTHLVIGDSLGLLQRYGLRDAIAPVSVGRVLLPVE